MATKLLVPVVLQAGRPRPARHRSSAADPQVSHRPSRLSQAINFLTPETPRASLGDGDSRRVQTKGNEWSPAPGRRGAAHTSGRPVPAPAPGRRPRAPWTRGGQLRRRRDEGRSQEGRPPACAVVARARMRGGGSSGRGAKREGSAHARAVCALPAVSPRPVRPCRRPDWELCGHAWDIGSRMRAARSEAPREAPGAGRAFPPRGRHRGPVSRRARRAGRPKARRQGGLGAARREPLAGGCSFWEALQSSRFCSSRRSGIAGSTERWAVFPRKPGQAGMEGPQDRPLQVRLRLSGLFHNPTPPRGPGQIPQPM